MNTFYNSLLDITSPKNIFQNEPMKNHTTFKVGGNADYFICPSTPQEVISIIHLCQENNLPFYVIGKGSNLLVADSGYRGVIIQTNKNLNHLEVKGNEIIAQAGASLLAISDLAIENSLTGFEFASGIPGSLGGACIMNAGAYDGEMKLVLKEVTALDENYELKVFKGEEMGLGYRTSIFSQKGYIVLAAVIALKEGNQEEIQAKVDDLTKQRESKQPLEYPSAGSTFKRPVGHFTGKLVREAGLSGKMVGGAMVSTKHNGFIINAKNATAADIVNLIDLVIATVKEKFDVTLEPEVKRIGEF